MHWFEGSITAAITAAKQKKVLFVVYVRGEDDVSKQMDATWADEGVSQLCNESGMVVIKFNSDSDECKQFSQFYPVICVPCVSFISGDTGVPLEGAAGYVNSSDFRQKIQKVLHMASTQSISSPGAGTSTQSPGPQLPSSTPSQPMDTVDAPSQSQTTSAAPDTQKEKKELSKLEKAARLRQKMEEIHQRKEKQKSEEEKRKEIERRKVGQAVQQSAQERVEKDAKRLAGEIRKEKEEDRLAKERIREQIARDRAEKQSRYDADKKEKLKTKEAASEAAKVSASEAPKRKINMLKGKGQRRKGRGVVKVGKFKVWNCLKCGNEYHQPGSLYRHMRIEHGPKLYGFCLQCSFKTNRRDNLRRHYRMEHPLHIIELESIRFESIEARDERVQRENSEKVPATSKRSASRKKVRKDETVVSSVLLPALPSEDVSKSSNASVTSLDGQRQDAQKSEHDSLFVTIKVEPEDPWLDLQPMPELSLAASGSQSDENSSDIYKRIAGGSTDMHKCPKCTKQYTQYTSLWRHIKLDHGPRTFSWCRRCSFYSNRRDNLRRHYKQVHSRYFSDFKKITPETPKQKKRRERQERQGSHNVAVQGTEELMQMMIGSNESLEDVNESTLSAGEMQMHHTDWEGIDDNVVGEENHPEMISVSETPGLDYETSPSGYGPLQQHLEISNLVRDSAAAEIPSSSQQNFDAGNSLLPFMTCSSDQLNAFTDLGQDNDMMSQVQGTGGDAYSFKCPKCKNEYQNRSSLYRHLRNDHGPPLFLWCRHCIFHTKRKYNLKRHYCHLHKQFVGELDVIEFETREEVEHRTGQELVLRNRAKLSKKSPWTIKRKYRNMKALPQGSDTSRFAEEQKQIRARSINSACLTSTHMGNSFVPDAVAYPQSSRQTPASSARIPAEGTFPLQRVQFVNVPPMSNNKSLQPAMYGGSGMSNSLFNYPLSTPTQRMVRGQTPYFGPSNPMNFPPGSSAHISFPKQSPVLFKRPYVTANIPNPAHSSASHNLVQEPSSVTAVQGPAQESSSVTAVRGSAQKASPVTPSQGPVQEPGSVTAACSLVQEPSSVTAARSVVQEPSSVTASHGSVQEQSSVTSTCENPNNSVPLTKLERVLRGKVTEVVEEAHTVTYCGGEKVKEETIKRTYKVMFDAEFGDGKVEPF